MANVLVHVLAGEWGIDAKLDRDAGQPKFFRWGIFWTPTTHPRQDFKRTAPPVETCKHQLPPPIPNSPTHPSDKMAETGSKIAPSDRTVIGITFGNSNSSIAYTVDDKAEVIANEDGGKR